MLKKLKTFPVLFLFSFFQLAGAQSDISTITVKEESVSSLLEASGFFEVPLQELPVSASVISSEDIEKNNIHRLSDVTSLDASTTDSYNATGYWDSLTVRGYLLDNRYSFQREGLPISAETSLPLDNKERVEILKGISGVQNGVSSPGGLVNYVIKRPLEIRQVRTELRDRGNFLIAADVGGQSNKVSRLGYRLNIAHENLRPLVNQATGERFFLSLANDLELSENSLLETDVEWSRQTQSSQAGMSLLGDTLPEVRDPNLNLNNQSWSQPVVFEGITGSVRWTQKISAQTSWYLLMGMQDLKSDDHLAYPYGCSAEGKFDRYCSDGTFDLYDFRSDNERRTTQSLRSGFEFLTETGPIFHKAHLGILGSSARERFERQAYNYVGIGNVTGTVDLPPNPATNDPNTQRDSSVQEVFIFDNLSWRQWRGWLGLRYSDVDRSSVRTDGSRQVGYHERFTTPWAALSYEFEHWMIYTSYGEGVETFVTPNRDGYTHRGQFLSDVISRQIEVGLRGESLLKWSFAFFEIKRPVVEDQKPLYQIDGEAVHRGVEMESSQDLGLFGWRASAMLLEARRQGSSLSPQLNNKKTVNVPEQTLRFHFSYRVPRTNGLDLSARVLYEGERAVLADNSIRLPAWTRIDMGAAYAFGAKDERTLVQFSIENILDRKYWRESPTQYGHIYLYPGSERRLFVSAQTSF